MSSIANFEELKFLCESGSADNEKHYMRDEFLYICTNMLYRLCATAIATPPTCRTIEI